MTRIGAVILKQGWLCSYRFSLIVQENGQLRDALFNHVSGLRYERIA